MDGRLWLEWDVIGSGCGVYLLIDNDGGGGIGYLYSSQRSVVKPDSEDEGSGEKCEAGEETLCAQARNATASKTLITPIPNTTHTNPQVHGGF